MTSPYFPTNWRESITTWPSGYPYVAVHLDPPLMPGGRQLALHICFYAARVESPVYTTEALLPIGSKPVPGDKFVCGTCAMPLRGEELFWYREDAPSMRYNTPALMNAQSVWPYRVMRDSSVDTRVDQITRKLDRMAERAGLDLPAPTREEQYKAIRAAKQQALLAEAKRQADAAELAKSLCAHEDLVWRVTDKSLKVLGQGTPKPSLYPAEGALYALFCRMCGFPTTSALTAMTEAPTCTGRGSSRFTAPEHRLRRITSDLSGSSAGGTWGVTRLTCIEVEQCEACWLVVRRERVFIEAPKDGATIATPGYRRIVLNE